MHESHFRAGLGARQPDCARQRQPEHAEAVSHANAQVNAERRWWHQPAIEARPCDRALAIENSDVTAADGSSAIVTIAILSFAARSAGCLHSMVQRFKGSRRCGL